MKLLLKACGAAMIGHFERATRVAHGHAKQIVGRKFEPKEGRLGAWVPLPEGTEVTLDEDDVHFAVHVVEYRTACRDGDLEPGDAATAQALGVPWVTSNGPGDHALRFPAKPADK